MDGRESAKKLSKEIKMIVRSFQIVAIRHEEDGEKDPDWCTHLAFLRKVGEEVVVDVED